MNSWRLLTKYAITTLTVVVVSEVAKISDKIGGLLAALPLVTILTLIWLHVEGESTEKISLHAWYTFWYVVPTLPMFVAFPIFYDYLNFWWSLMLVCVLTILCFEVFALFVQRWGIELM